MRAVLNINVMAAAYVTESPGTRISSCSRPHLPSLSTPDALQGKRRDSLDRGERAAVWVGGSSVILLQEPGTAGRVAGGDEFT